MVATWPREGGSSASLQVHLIEGPCLGARDFSVRVRKVCSLSGNSNYGGAVQSNDLYEESIVMQTPRREVTARRGFFVWITQHNWSCARPCR
jgi:hypothetical protein